MQRFRWSLQATVKALYKVAWKSARVPERSCDFGGRGQPGGHPGPRRGFLRSKGCSRPCGLETPSPGAQRQTKMKIVCAEGPCRSWVSVGSGGQGHGKRFGGGFPRQKNEDRWRPGSLPVLSPASTWGVGSAGTPTSQDRRVSKDPAVLHEWFSPTAQDRSGSFSSGQGHCDLFQAILCRILTVFLIITLEKYKIRAID